MIRASGLALLLLLAACGDGTQTTDAGPNPAPPANPATGLITELEHAEGTVSALTVKVDGTEYRFLIDPEHDYGFDLNHLEEHASEELPVSVSFETRTGGIYATAIDDA